MSSERYYVYRFFDKFERIIYIGRTRDIVNRIEKQHFGGKGHLSQDCYDEVRKVEYAELSSANEQYIYEIYLISQHKPMHNTQFMSDSNIEFQLPGLEWKVYRFAEKDKNDYLELLYKAECEITRVDHRVNGWILNIEENIDDKEKVFQYLSCIREEMKFLVEYKDNHFSISDLIKKGKRPA